MNSFQHHPQAVPDAHLVPVRDAATVMIIADRPELEVLMVERTRRAVFGASAWVFPGGRVDADDQIDLSRVAFGLSDKQASNELGIDAGGLAWWLAGLRETVEESGLLLGVNESADAEAVSHVRRAVHEDADALIEALIRTGLRLDLRQLHDVGQFVTPEGPPRRYDTRFFVAMAPPGQEASHDEEEVVQHRWVTPRRAIDDFRAGQFPLMSVTHRMLECLSRYDSAAHVIDAAAQRQDRRHVRVNDPDGEYHVVLPGEPGYETAELEIEHGWVSI